MSARSASMTSADDLNGCTDVFIMCAFRGRRMLTSAAMCRSFLVGTAGRLDSVEPHFAPVRRHTARAQEGLRKPPGAACALQLQARVLQFEDLTCLLVDDAAENLP